MMTESGTVAGFANQGCYVACHNGTSTLSNAISSADVKAHPYFGDEGRKLSEIRKYILESRNGETWHEASWDNVKTQEELDALAASGLRS